MKAFYFQHMNRFFNTWQSNLSNLLEIYNTKRPKMVIFFPILFILFFIINDLCYWWAMFTAFPELTVGFPFQYYFKVQFPVAILGALFDSLSFFITINIVRSAIKDINNIAFLTYLSIDLIIAILATLWVLLVFTFSSWLIHQFFPELQDQSSFETRQVVYSQRVVNAVKDPSQNLKNIYFGLIMGVSAMLPTVTHIGIAIWSWIKKR